MIKESLYFVDHYKHTRYMVSMIFKDISKDLNMVCMCFDGILKVLTMFRVRGYIRVVTKHLRLPSRLLKITRSR